MVEVFRNEAPSIIESIEKDIKRKSIWPKNIKINLGSFAVCA
jgi:hypothetical protein